MKIPFKKKKQPLVTDTKADVNLCFPGFSHLIECESAEPLYIPEPGLNILLSSDRKIYQIHYTKKFDNKEQKSWEYHYMVLYFSGRHLVVFDTDRLEMRTIFIDRIDKVMIGKKTVNPKQFFLSNGFKYKLIFTYFKHYESRFVIQLVIHNIKIHLNTEKLTFS